MKDNLEVYDSWKVSALKRSGFTEEQAFAIMEAAGGSREPSCWEELSFNYWTRKKKKTVYPNYAQKGEILSGLKLTLVGPEIRTKGGGCGDDYYHVDIDILAAFKEWIDEYTGVGGTKSDAQRQDIHCRGMALRHLSRQLKLLADLAMNKQGYGM